MVGERNSPYHAYWDRIGASFPSLKGAASTRYYLQCERMLFDAFYPAVDGKSVFKTDLWDEAKNTEILGWLATRGALPVGIDVSLPTVLQAREITWNRAPLFAAGDVRQIPFRSDTFDVVYSMGTIEHMPDYERAVAEIFRVLKPGGTAIVGVPNKLDPFLRPALVTLLNLVGGYPYGREKSFTPRELRRLLESAGFEVTARSGILFIPGWLRMLDLLLYTRRSRLGWVTRGAVALFAWIYRRFPSARQHGYLIADRARKPGG